MGILDDIQAMTLDDAAPLSGLLHRCLVLASTLGHEPLQQWVDWELDGYQNEGNLPDYRRLKCIVKFNGTNIAWRATGLEIPYYNFPENLQQAASSSLIYSKVSELEAMSKLDNINLSVPALVRYWVEQNVFDGDVTSVYFSISPIYIAGILGSIRTRILRFSLSLATAYPEVNTAAIGSHPIPQDAIDRRFHSIIIHGDNNAIVMGNQNTAVAGIKNRVKAGDFSSLRQALLEEGFDETDVDELETIIDENFTEDSLQRGEGRIGGWVHNKVSKILPAGGLLARELLVNLIVTLIMAFVLNPTEAGGD